MNPRPWLALGVALLLHGLLLLPRSGGVADAHLAATGDGGAPTEQAPQPARETRRVALRLALPAVKPGALHTGVGGGGSAAGGVSYLALVRSVLDRRARELAGSLDGSGVVEVRFAVAADGRITQAELATASGQASLDVAALQLVRDSSPLPPPPQPLRLRVPVEFR